MIGDSQNNSGFFQTHAVSKESLIEGIPNFDLNSEEVEVFSDAALEIPERLMLGKRAERYLSEWIKRSDSYELIAENIQIIDNKQTLGEFDFIIQRKLDKQLIHIELIYKFYLFDPASEGKEIEKWIGPNRGDRLDFKRDKLANHQFPLLKTEPARKRLNELGIDVSKVEQQVLFLANLFVPKGQKVEFNRVNNAATEGTWLNLEEWKKSASSENVFAIPTKKDWFSRKLKNADWQSREEAMARIEELHNQKRSPLVWTKTENGHQFRDFVVWW